MKTTKNSLKIRKTTTDARARLAKGDANKRQGMNWITQHKRLAVYLRDGLSCAWCGDSVENGAKLSLDHLIAHSKGGSNHESNLVTCCSRCNSSRGNRSRAGFAKAVAGYVNHGVKADDILSHVRRCAARILKPYIAEAKAMIERRGSAAKVLSKLTK